MPLPTGSGKTTTLAAALNELPKDIKVITVEDPVEISVKGITQLPASDKYESRSFTNLAKAALRMDPDVLMIGEIRDLATAKTAVRASTTGHLVFTTLHTNRAISVPETLVDLGISRDRLTDPSFLLLLISQRLIAYNCPLCRIPFKQFHKQHRTDPVLDKLVKYSRVFKDNVEKIHFMNHHGCDKCQYKGVTGKGVIAEIIRIDDAALGHIKTGDIHAWELQLREQGWESYIDHAKHLILRGLLDPINAERVVGSLSMNNNLYDYNQIRESVRHEHIK